MVPVWAPVTLALSILGISGRVPTGLGLRRRAELGDGARKWVGKAWSGTGAGNRRFFQTSYAGQAAWFGVLAHMCVCVCVCVSTVHVDSMCTCNVTLARPSRQVSGKLTPGRPPKFFDIRLVLRGQVWAVLGRHSALAANSCPCPLCRLLVGAPQALALPGQQANRTGGLFACPLSLEETDCYRVDIDHGGVDPCRVGGGMAQDGEERTRPPLPSPHSHCPASS